MKQIETFFIELTHNEEKKNTISMQYQDFMKQTTPNERGKKILFCTTKPDRSNNVLFGFIFDTIGCMIWFARFWNVN